MDFQVYIPFVEALGFELLRFENGQAEIAMTPREEHMNSWSVVHGGVIMTLLDVAMAHAARSPIEGTPRDPRGVVTVEMKTGFMRPGIGRILARAKVLHTLAGRSLLQHVLQTALALEADRIVVITGHGADEVEASVSAPHLQFVRRWPLQRRCVGLPRVRPAAW